MSDKPDLKEMTPRAIVDELNDSGEEWSIQPQLDGEHKVTYYVTGVVLPYYRGQRSRRGRKPFVGSSHEDPMDAIRSGLLAMRRAERSSNS